VRPRRARMRAASPAPTARSSVVGFFPVVRFRANPGRSRALALVRLGRESRHPTPRLTRMRDRVHCIGCAWRASRKQTRVSSDHRGSIARRRCSCHAPLRAPARAVAASSSSCRRPTVTACCLAAQHDRDARCPVSRVELRAFRRIRTSGAARRQHYARSLWRAHAWHSRSAM